MALNLSIRKLQSSSAVKSSIFGDWNYMSLKHILDNSWHSECLSYLLISQLSVKGDKCIQSVLKVFPLNISYFTHKAETYVDVDIFSIFAILMIVMHFY